MGEDQGVDCAIVVYCTGMRGHMMGIVRILRL